MWNQRVWLPFLLCILMILGGIAACSGGGGLFGAIAIVDITPRVAVAGTTQSFTVETTGDVDTIDWDFGGGAEPNLASGVAPTVTIGAAGAYVLTLTAHGPAGQQVAQSFTFTVLNSLDSPHLLGVTPAGRFGGPGETVTIGAVFEGFVATYAWDFGTGATPATSTNAMPVITLGAAGVYDGSVEVSSIAGTDRLEFQYGVSSSNVPIRIVSIGMEGKTFELEEVTQASAVVEGTVATWHWEFVSGVSKLNSTESHPVLRMLELGSHSGRLTITDADGNTESSDFTFDIIQLKPEVTVAPLRQPLGAVGERHFIPLTSAHLPENWNWQLSGGVMPLFSSEQKPLFTLTDAGRFHGQVTASNEVGTSAPAEFDYVVSPYPASPPIVKAPMPGRQSYPISLVRFPNGQLATLNAGNSEQLSGQPLKLLRSSTAFPSGIDDWVSTDIGNFRSPCGELLVHDDQLIQLVNSLDNKVLLVFTQGIPTGSNDWSVISLPIDLRESGVTHWIVIDDRPMLILEHNQTREWRLLKGKIPHPQLASDWDLLPVRAGNTERIAERQLALYRGRAALFLKRLNKPVAMGGRYSRLHILRADVAQPQSAGDWSESEIDPDVPFGQIVSAVDGNTLWVSSVAGFGFKLHRTDVGDPQMPSDWESQNVQWFTTDQPKPIGDLPVMKMTVLDGRLLILRGRVFLDDVKGSGGQLGIFELDRCVLPGLQPEDAWVRYRANVDSDGAGHSVGMTMLADGRPAFLVGGTLLNLVYPNTADW